MALIKYFDTAWIIYIFPILQGADRLSWSLPVNVNSPWIFLLFLSFSINSLYNTLSLLEHALEIWSIHNQGHPKVISVFNADATDDTGHQVILAVHLDNIPALDSWLLYGSWNPAANLYSSFDWYPNVSLCSWRSLIVIDPSPHHFCIWVLPT